MTKPSVELVEFLTRMKLPWMYYDESKGKIIIVIDNHLASQYRACPQHFVYSAVYGIAPKSPVKENERARIWFLDFGIILHKMIELYYKEFRNEGFDAVKWATERATREWFEAGMDVHAEHKEYKLIGGLAGFVGLLCQFSHVFKPENEKIRIIGQEVSFGRRGEVPLLITEFFELYLAGRMDLIVDDGYFICPMDHKSEGYFKGDPAIRYETEEGPTGYVFALHKLLPQMVGEDQILKRDCNKILMNLISKKPTDTPQERFKRIALRKTTEQLAQYQDRMITTCMHLLNDVENLAHEMPVYRNTFACTDWKHGLCQYRDVCRQGTKDGEQATLKNGYVQVALWDTEAVLPTT